jgi:hypothetical protein
MNGVDSSFAMVEDVGVADGPDSTARSSLMLRQADIVASDLEPCNADVVAISRRVTGHQGERPNSDTTRHRSAWTLLEA